MYTKGFTAREIVDIEEKFWEGVEGVYNTIQHTPYTEAFRYQLHARLKKIIQEVNHLEGVAPDIRLWHTNNKISISLRWYSI